MAKFTKINGKVPSGELLHYTACGLDDVYLVNGFTRETIDGEEFTTIEDLDSLWKAIALHLVTKKKVLAPKELRFLREQMDLTQAELAARARVSDQTVARWEKGKGTKISGPADVAVRVLFLASERAQPEGGEFLEKLIQMVDDLVESDEPADDRSLFRHGKKNWTDKVAPKQLALA